MVVARLAAAQVALGHEVIIVCNDSPGYEEDIKTSLAGIPHFQEVTSALLPAGGFFDKITAKAAREYLRGLVRAGDMLHLHGLWRPIVLAAATTAQQSDVKYVVTTHAMLHPWCLRQKQWRKKIALRLVWRKLLDRASFLHVLNAEEASIIKSLKFCAPIELIPNGVFPEEINCLPPKNSFYQAHPQLKNRPYIFFLGRLHYTKGLDYLADAFGMFAQLNSEVDLVVAGPDGGMRSEFELKIAELGLTERVHIVGPLYGKSKYAALVDALCFCLPSQSEGFSMAITEAMGCGLPVVITKNCHFPEVAEVGAGEVVDLDAQAISMALVRITSDEGWRYHAGNAARELVLSSYTWPKIAEKTIVAYERALTAA